MTLVSFWNRVSVLTNKKEKDFESKTESNLPRDLHLHSGSHRHPLKEVVVGEESAGEPLLG